MAEITRITVDALRRMNSAEGLILQGCGGDPKEWLDGINQMLTDDGILLDGSRFEKASVFEHDGLTNMLFDFNNVKLDMGRLAMWRLQTHSSLGGTWLSDYVPNRLGGFEPVTEPSAVELFHRQIEDITAKSDDIDISLDFQCDQTEGFPTMLCVSWELEKAWLQPAEHMAESDTELAMYNAMCAKFDIRNCSDAAEYNSILRSLGEDAIQSAGIPDEDDQSMGGME